MTLRRIIPTLSVTLVALVLTAARPAPTEKEKADLETCKEMVSVHKGIRKDAGDIVADLAIARELAGQRVKAYEALAERLRSRVAEIDGVMKIQRGNFLIRLPASVFFQSGQFTIKQETRATLVEIAEILAVEADRDIYVEGHTDNVPIAKKNKALKSNMELSAKRSLAVLNVLQEAGLDPDSLAAAAMGEHHPLVANDSEEGRATNRRVMLLVSPRIDEIPVMAELLPPSDE